MKKRLFVYSLAAWLTTITISPALFFFLVHDYSGTFVFHDFLGFWGEGVLGGLIISPPGYLLLVGALYYLHARKWSDGIKKASLILWTVLLIGISVYLVFGTDEDTLYYRYVPRIFVSYSVLMAGSILSYGAVLSI